MNARAEADRHEAPIDKTSVTNSSLDRLRRTAEAANLVLLSSEWDTWKANYAFGCAQGHRFVRSASFALLHPMCCPDCRLTTRLAALKRVAQEKGGECLETAWQGSKVPHRLRCGCGHNWKARPSRIITDGSWCPRCAQQEHSKRMMRLGGLESLQEMAVQQGGRLLDTVYSGMHARYRFCCAQGHHCQAKGGEVARGSWCRACANADKSQQYRLRDGLTRLQAAAQAKQGICLSTEYILSRSSYRFRCRQGHEWQASGQRIFRGAWCPVCANEHKRLSIDDMRQLARQRGGQCLSDHYRNNSTKLHWECHRGHQWQAMPSSILRGHWCPSCAHFSQISNPASRARSKYRPVK